MRVKLRWIPGNRCAAPVINAFASMAQRLRWTKRRSWIRAAGKPCKSSLTGWSSNESDRSRISDSVEQALSLGIGVLQIAIANADREEPNWETKTHSQHLVCGDCGRSFQTLTPHHFSFNSAVGWCPQCEGLGSQTGTNPAALISSPTATLGRWSSFVVAQRRQVGFDVDAARTVATDRHRASMCPLMKYRSRSDACSFMARVRRGSKSVNPTPKQNPSLRTSCFVFNSKVFILRLEEASRLTPGLRGKLEMFVDEINCSACDGSRLQEDAAACRFRGHTIADIVHMPLDRLADTAASWKLHASREKDRR